MARTRLVEAGRQSYWSSLVYSLRVLAEGVKYMIRPRRRFTILYPRERVAHEEGFRGYIELSLPKCIGCRSCERVCPARAIEMVAVASQEARSKLAPRFNYQRCIFCGFCVDVCPTNALSHIESLDQVYERLEDMAVEPGEPPTRLPEEGEPRAHVIDEEEGLVKVRER
ncbi:MAG: NADH-quinone oxidoreductase subunit I [Acidilobaceae archaeon]